MKKPGPRNPYVVNARLRTGGAHVSQKDLTRRGGGSRNDSRDMLEEYEQEVAFIKEDEEPSDEVLKELEDYNSYLDDQDAYDEEQMECQAGEGEDEEF